MKVIFQIKYRLTVKIRMHNPTFLHVSYKRAKVINIFICHSLQTKKNGDIFKKKRGGMSNFLVLLKKISGCCGIRGKEKGSVR